MKKKLISLVGVLAVSVLFLGACGNSEKASDKKETQTSSSVAESKMLTVKDSEGNDVEVPSKPSKVVVFDMGSLDTINQLGAGIV